MKKFKFTLDKLKSFKEQVKKKEENELAALRMRYHELIAEREAMEVELEKKNNEFIENSAKGMTAREVVTAKGFISYLIDGIKAKNKEIAAQNTKVQRQLHVVIEATKEVTTLEKLEEKQLAEYKFKAAKADEAFIEEYVNNREHTGNNQ